MAEDRTASANVVYRAVLLAAGLLLFGLLFRQLVTLLLAILITIMVAIPLAAGASRLERYRIPRPLGALISLLAGIGLLALVIYLLTPPFIEQTNEFVDDVPGIVTDLEEIYADLTGQDAGEVGDQVQQFVERYTDDPDRLIGPITSIGLSVAGVAAALVLILITAYYMAVRPEPLVNGLVRLAPPRRREHVRHVLGRVRRSWIGWMEGVGIDMVVTFVLLWIGLRAHRARLRDLLRGAVGAARGRALLRCDRRRDPPRCSLSPIRPARLCWCWARTSWCSRSRAT